MSIVQEVIPLALLVGALAFFLISTAQADWRLRLIAWLVALAFLGGGAALVFGDPRHYGLFRITGDVITNPTDSAAGATLAENWAVVSSALLAMFDVFVLAVATVAVIALAAFTRGQVLERITRPIAILLAGAVIGGVGALSIAAISFDSAVRRGAFAGVLHASNVIDADTLRFGMFSVRLVGLDALEANQECLGPEGENVRCGQQATEFVRDLVDSQIVVCRAAPTNGGPTYDSYGRPIARCEVHRDGAQRQDISMELANHGWAATYQDPQEGQDDLYADDIRGASSDNLGVWASYCALHPRLWRRRESREAFLRRDPLGPNGLLKPDDLWGDCDAYPRADTR